MMEAGSWKKSPPELVELFHDVFPPAPATARQMFGYPAGFVNGNMFVNLFQESFIVRLGDQDREALLKMDGAKTFEPMAGRPMKEYVVLPESILSSKPKLGKWMAKALDYGASLPPKKPKAKKAKE